jgi:hypothetical protein
MNTILVGAVVCAIAISAPTLAMQSDTLPDGHPVVKSRAEMDLPRLEAPTTERIDIFAQPAFGNHLAACHLAGRVTLWVSRRLRVLDDMLEEVATIKAGLAQFGKGSNMKGCVSDDATFDLSDQFVNFVVADHSPRNAGANREATGALASQLAQDFYHLAERDGTPVPLVDGFKISAIGSVSHQFTIVLVRNGKPGSFDAIVHRETLRTKFSARLPEADRRLSRAKWSSIQQD